MFDFIRDGLAMAPEEGLILYSLVKALKPEVCFEIGTHQGFSTLHIAQALEENNKGHLWTTDPHDYNTEVTLSRGAKDRITCLHEMGKDVKLENKIDFAFVDGLHHVTDVLPEIQNLLPQLNEGAIVVFHDAQDEPTNWAEGVNAAIKKTGLKTVQLPTTYGLQIYKHENISSHPNN